MTNCFNELISVEELLQLIQKNKIVIFDCRFYLDDPSRGRKEYLHSHIPQAVYLDINHDLSSPVIKGVTGRHPLPHHDVLTATLRAAGLDNESQVVAYDQSNGSYAARAWWLLRWLGHEHVAVLDGGFDEWNKINGPVDNEWPLPSPGNFQAHLRDDLMIEKEAVNKLNDSL